MSTGAGERAAVAMNVELGGRHEASARLELLDGPGLPRVARVALRGRIDRAAERRLEAALDAFRPRDVARVVVDCSEMRRVEGRQVERILASVARVVGSIEVWGLPRPLGSRIEGRLRALASPGLRGAADGRRELAS